MSRDNRDMQNFIRHVRPSARYFYRAAYAITADRQMAEYALSSALVDAYLRGIAPGGSLSFRDSILAIIREKALSLLSQEKSENDWDGLNAADPQLNDKLNALLLNERLDVQRMMVLRYGCAMTVREIASVTETEPEKVQETLNRCRLHIERILSNAHLPVHPFEKVAMRSIRRAMNHERENQIDVSYILSSFEAELKGRRRSRKIVMKVIRTILFAFVALLCAFAFWLVAVLMGTP